MRTIFVSILALVLSTGPVGADGSSAQPLFKIERSKNANIVQYDARIDEDGLLNPAEPVVAYWIRHAEQGQVKELSWTQKTFAYGFGFDLSDDRTTAELKLKIDLGRRLIVRQVQGQFRAVIDIDNQPAVLETVFVESSGKGLSTKVHFIDLNGRTLNGNASVRERIIP